MIRATSLAPTGAALRHPALLAAALGAAVLLASCGSGSGSATGASGTPPAVQTVVSTSTLLPASCGTALGSAQDAYDPGSAVQPQLAVLAPGGAAGSLSPAMMAVWEQDRWNAIGTRAIAYSYSADGGQTWRAPGALPFSACGVATGGGAGAGASYDRASDPSVAISTAGSGPAVVLASSLAFSAGGFLAAGGTSAVLMARSLDGGLTWQATHAAIQDSNSASGTAYFNDRDAIAADPAGPNAYLVWDRISSVAGASIPTWMAHSGNSGATWDAARVIYDPGTGCQTFNNQPLVLPDQSVVVIFTLLPNGLSFCGPELSMIRSTDHGTTWPVSGAATKIAAINPVGTRNPIPNGAPIRDSANLAQAAVDPASGAIAAVWQESSFSGGVRDGIAFTISRDQGASWSLPIQVNGQPGVAAFDPCLHFGAGGRIAVTYYDLRAYSAGSSVLSTTLWLRESTDFGQTWSADRRIDGPFDLNLAPPADQAAGTTGKALFLGDQQGLGWNGASWTPVYAATVLQGARVFAAQVAP